MGKGSKSKDPPLHAVPEGRVKIVIETIPHTSQRYPTVGDWWIDDDGTWQIRVSEPPETSTLFPEKFAFLVALHELVEMAMCRSHGITGEEIDSFDKHFAGEGEPGDDKNAPYHFEHRIATGVEVIIAAQLGVDWNEYDRAIEDLSP